MTNHKREQQREYYQKNKEKVKERHRKYYEKNREKDKKRVREWEKNNRGKYLELKKKGNQKRMERVKSVLEQIRSVGCYLCPEKDTDILEFAHIDTRAYYVSEGKSLTQVLKEVEKCEVMCPTCHRKFDLGKLKLDKALSKKVR